MVENIFVRHAHDILFRYYSNESVLYICRRELMIEQKVVTYRAYPFSLDIVMAKLLNIMSLLNVDCLLHCHCHSSMSTNEFYTFAPITAPINGKSAAVDIFVVVAFFGSVFYRVYKGNERREGVILPRSRSRVSVALTCTAY